ncbi:MAG: hypothetical protein AAFU85_04995, partial [Planctomycetota bacterium]
MPSIGRRTFFAHAACSSALLTGRCSAELQAFDSQASETRGEQGTGDRLLKKYFSLHFPTVGVRAHEQEECEAAEQIIRRHVGRFLQVVASIVGTAPLAERLEDLAEYNPITKGSIPLVYIPQPEHSHNILPGLPYTGVFLGRSPGLSFIAPHEVGHIVFGKFNDGLTEPVADLFVERPSPSAGPSKSPDFKGKRIPLIANEAILLAVLELWKEGTEIADARSLHDLFRHRPSFRLMAETRFRQETQTNNRDAAMRTNKFLGSVIARNYERDFQRYTTLQLPELTHEESIAIDDWMRRDAREAIASRSHNPNESRGVIRSFHGLIDTGLMKFLLEHPLGGSADGPVDVSPAQARDSICRFLNFYFDPITQVPGYGYRSLEALETKMREELQDRGSGLRNRLDWFELKEFLRRSPCYRPATWNDSEC